MTLDHATSNSLPVSDSARLAKPPVDLERATLILAAHGSPIDPSVNEAVVERAGRVRAQSPVREVFAAFHYGRPGFAEALQLATQPIKIVVPLMTSEGFFSRVVLREAISELDPRDRAQVTLADPVGTHPRVVNLIHRRILEVLKDFDWPACETTALLVGHGTRRHANSRQATLDVVQKTNLLGQRVGLRVSAAFIDDEPQIVTQWAKIQSNYLLVLPFLISAGPHAKIDIPTSLGYKNSLEQVNLPLHFARRGIEILIDQPFGSLPDLDELIVERAIEAFQILRRNRGAL